MLLLTTLKWDVSVVVSTDFIDHLLARLHLSSEFKSAPFVHLMEEVKRSSIGLCLLCSKGKSFYPFIPSSLHPMMISLIDTEIELSFLALLEVKVSLVLKSC